MGVGFPETLKLERFGVMLVQVFGQHIYHVGSSAKRKKPFRDVDVVAILDDELAAILETDGQPVSTEGREGQFTDAMKEQLADLGYLVD